MDRRRRPISVGTTLSLGAHLFGAAVALVATRHPLVVLRPMHLAGTAQGQRMLLSYSSGNPLPSQSSSVMRREAPSSTRQKLTAVPSKSASLRAVPPPSEAGPGNSGDSALGDGDVRIALPQVHPRPQPDLTGLPHGTAGDVIVDVTIDDTGKVTATTLIKGLGAPVDVAVLQVLQGWTFTPATRNGQNIASEQEILIHYERG